MIAIVADAPAPVQVEVTGVRNARGRVHVGLCPRALFTKGDCPYEGSAPATPGTTIVTLPAVPPGDYGAQAFHDENNNDKVDQNFLGIPKEGVGFSRNAPIRLGPPKWAAAVFSHGSQPQVIRFALRYFMGPSGPTK